MKVEVKGLDSLMAQLQRLETTSDQDIADVINETLITTHNHAVTSIQNGPATGKTYKKYNPRRTHRASAPGEAPMTDTGRLASSVAYEVATTSALVGRVGTNVGYGPMLEFGTSRMVSRPWLNPAFELANADVEARLKRKFENEL